MHKEIEHPTLGKILYVKRIKSKSIRVSVNFANEIKVSIPFFVTYGMARKFVDDNLDKIEAIIKRMQARKRISQNTGETLPNAKKYTREELEDIKARAHNLLPDRLAYWSLKLNKEVVIKNAIGIQKMQPFSYNRLFIKNNKTNWGSCSSKGNINLNMHLVNLPQELMDFVIVHELCHLVYSNHGAEFHKLVDMIFEGGEKELQRRLRSYSYLLQGIK